MNWKLTFDSLQRAIAKEQVVVLYDGNVEIDGRTIIRAGKLKLHKSIDKE